MKKSILMFLVVSFPGVLCAADPSPQDSSLPLVRESQLGDILEQLARQQRDLTAIRVEMKEVTKTMTEITGQLAALLALGAEARNAMRPIRAPGTL